MGVPQLNGSLGSLADNGRAVMRQATSRNAPLKKLSAPYSCLVPSFSFTLIIHAPTRQKHLNVD